MGKDGSLKPTPQELGTKEVYFLGTVANEDKLEKKNYDVHAFFVHGLWPAGNAKQSWCEQKLQGPLHAQLW